MANVMIDIETMGTRPGCRVIQIGAVRFRFDGLGEVQDEFIENIDQFDRASMTFEKDPITAAWWHDQPQKTKDTWQTPSPVGLAEALETLQRFIKSNDQVWAKPPTFDLAILRFVYEKMEMKCPWHYRMECDARTVYKILPAKGKEWVNEQLRERRTSEWIEHYALDDAKEQACAVALAVDWAKRETW